MAAAATSKLDNLNGKLAHAFGTAVGAVSVAFGEPAAFVAQSAESVYLSACHKAQSLWRDIKIAAPMLPPLV